MPRLGHISLQVTFFYDLNFFLIFMRLNVGWFFHSSYLHLGIAAHLKICFLLLETLAPIINLFNSFHLLFIYLLFSDFFLKLVCLLVYGYNFFVSHDLLHFLSLSSKSIDILITTLSKPNLFWSTMDRL